MPRRHSPDRSATSTDQLAERNPSRAPTYPGAIVHEDMLPALNLNVTEAARSLGVSRQTLPELLAEYQSSIPEMVLRVGKLPDNGVPF